MTTQFDIDCALMAGRAYLTTRKEINWFPVPDGWAEFFHIPNSTTPTTSGFEAISFQHISNPNEIVISFAGTYDKDITGDIVADIGLATGFGSEQLLQAAEYYLQVKAQVMAANPDATITLTGHSLGGGLASLVGVFFGVKAVTFDQAPFANTAEQNLLTTDAAAKLKSDLLLAGYSENDLAGLTNFLQLREANGGIPNSELVSNIRVDGEVLSSAPLSLYDPIGTIETVLDHGPYSSPSIDMHSMSLLTAFLQSAQSVANSDDPQQTLSEVTKKLTSLLGMFFDNELYSFDTDKGDENFLERLVKHHEGLDPTVPNDGDAMVGRFTTDMWKIAQDGGLTMDSNISKMLTAFAMQKYYEEPASGADHGETLFSDVTGGIRFNRADVADTLEAAKGYKYFQDYVGSLAPSEATTALKEEMPDLLDWYIQAGSQAMNATAGTQRAFMLGGGGDDTLTGGSQADVVVGNGGNDTLNGGAGNDLMIGGEGMDTYYIDGNDRIRDTGSNRLYYQGELLAGAFVREEGTNTYRFLSNSNITLTFNSPGHLVLNGTDSITFENQTSAADFENDTDTDITWRVAA